MGNSWPGKNHEIVNLYFHGHDKCFHGFLIAFSWDFHGKGIHSGGQ